MSVAPNLLPPPPDPVKVAPDRRRMWSDLCGGNAASSPEGYPAAALIDEEEFLYIWNTAASAAWETAIETSAMIVLDNPMIRGTSEADRIAAEIRYLSDKAPVQ